MKSVDLEFGKIAGYIIELYGQCVLALSRGDPAETSMDIKDNPKLLCLLIERPYLGIVYICVFRWIEFEDLGALLLDPVFKFPMVFLTPLCLIGETLG